MPYINLLPPEDRNRGMDFRRWLILGGCIIYLVSLSVIYLTNYNQVSQLRSAKVSLDEQLTMIEPTIHRLQQMEKDRQELEAKLQAGQSLDQEMYYSKLLIWLSTHTPSEVTLSRMSYDVDHISLEGDATDYGSIAKLIGELKGAEYFTEVELISSFASTSSDSAIGFKIRAKSKIKG